MEFDDDYCLKTWATPRKCDDALKHIAEKMGWIFEHENHEHYSCVQRLPRIDYDVPVHDFRLWYWTTHDAFFFNCGTYDDNFKEEPICCNNYTIGKIIKTMIDFDKQARKLELEERKKAISDAANGYEA
jgi:hypothetical protein